MDFLAGFLIGSWIAFLLSKSFRWIIGMAIADVVIAYRGRLKQQGG
jgi:hypothetical protein